MMTLKSESLKKAYLSEDFEQIRAVSKDIICMVTKDHIDFWKLHEKHLELIWSCQYRSHAPALLQLNKYVYTVRYVGSISNHEIIFQTFIKGKKEDFPAYDNVLFKIDLEERCIEYLSEIPHYNPFYYQKISVNSSGICLLNNLGSGDLFCGAEGMGLHFISLYVNRRRDELASIIGITKDNDLLLLHKHHLEIRSFPYLKLLVEEINAKIAQLKVNLKDSIPQGCQDTDNIIADYVGTDFKNKLSSEVKLSQCYESFYQSPLNKHSKNLNLEMKTDVKAIGKVMRSQGCSG